MFSLCGFIADKPSEESLIAGKEYPEQGQAGRWERAAATLYNTELNEKAACPTEESIRHAFIVYNIVL